MSMFIQEPLVYNDGRTKQSFKDQTDINVILRKLQKKGTLEHVMTFGGQYGNFAEFDFTTALTQITEAQQIFDQLPGEIRAEFGNEAKAFFEFVNDDENIPDLLTLLPGLAREGRQLPPNPPGQEDPVDPPRRPPQPPEEPQNPGNPAGPADTGGGDAT